MQFSTFDHGTLILIAVLSTAPALHGNLKTQGDFALLQKKRAKSLLDGIELQGESVNFMALGDWGLHTNTKSAVVRQMIKTASELNISFYIGLGDNVYHGGVARPNDPLLYEYFERSFSHPVFRKPWFHILGNHDYLSNVEAQVAYSKRSFRWRMPAKHYSFKLHHPSPKCPGLPLQFLMHDYRGIKKGWSVDWFRKAMSQTEKGAWKIISNHYPAGTATVRRVEGFSRKHIAPLMEAYDAQFWLAGHMHAMEAIVSSSNKFLQTTQGSGTTCYAMFPDRSKWNPNLVFGASLPGFGLYRIFCDYAEVKFIAADGRVVFEANVSRVDVPRVKVKYAWTQDILGKKGLLKYCDAKDIHKLDSDLDFTRD